MAAAGGERGRTSFQRRPGAGSRPPAVPGTRPSVRHGQLLLSSGLPSLDCVLGGGVAVGTLLLIAVTGWPALNYGSKENKDCDGLTLTRHQMSIKLL